MLAVLGAELDIVVQGQAGNLDELRRERAQTPAPVRPAQLMPPAHSTNGEPVMQLSVYVLGREVATLEQSGDFKSVLPTTRTWRQTTLSHSLCLCGWKATCGTTSSRPCCR